MDGVHVDYQYKVTHGPSVGTIVRTFEEDVDTDHPKWPQGLRTVDFTFITGNNESVRLAIVPSQLEWRDIVRGKKLMISIRGITYDRRFAKEGSWAVVEISYFVDSRDGKISFKFV